LKCKTVFGNVLQWWSHRNHVKGEEREREGERKREIALIIHHSLIIA